MSTRTTETADQKVTLVSVSKKVSNQGDSAKKFNIATDVNIKEGKTDGFTNGTIANAEGLSGNFQLNGGSFDLRLYNVTANQTVKEAAEAILNFLEAVTESETPKAE